MYDLVLKNAKILKGNLESEFSGDIGIKNGKITNIGIINPLENVEIIDCKNKYVSPGFIDSHTHDDLAYGDNLPELGKISQGITTVISGMCGFSLFPTNRLTSKLLQKKIAAFGKKISLDELNQYSSYRDYLKSIKKRKSRMNYKMLLGHGTLRMAVMGEEQRDPTYNEMEMMKNLIRESMEAGAMGLSAGLVYSPGSFSSESEITELLKAVAEYNGFYSVHLRSESDSVIEAVEEAIRSTKKAGVPLWISHHKIAGKNNWKKSDKTLQLVQKNIEEGMDITLDVYPYSAGSTLLSVVLPPLFLNKGTSKAIEKLRDPKQRAIVKDEILNPTYQWDNFYKNCDGFKRIYIVDAPFTKEATNKTLSDYAKELGKDEFETFFDLFIENEGNVLAVYFMMNEYDIKNILTYSQTVIGSDGASFNKEVRAHPRGFGTFPRVIKKYVIDEPVLSLNEAIYKMTGLPAEKLKLKTKGLIKIGNDADLVVFDINKLKDNATYENPYELSDGINYVIVNGQITYRNKILTDIFAGRLF